MESLTVPADLDSLATISVFITDATARAGLDDHAAWQVQLAVDEASTNIIQHGYSDDAPGEIELAWYVDGPDLVVTLRDRGRRFNPHDVPAPDITSPLEERQAGGLGLYLMGRLMDSVAFEFDDAQGNLLRMTKRIGATGSPAQIFDLAGRLDAVSSQAAIARVYAAISAGARHVLLDMSQVTFLSSSARSPQVHEVFTLTGFTQVFAIHSTREEALRAFGREQV
jgi:serine/threonine-protein kinase RsbW